jgi:predicted DNA-binding protein YlxM (UPF0122 family)
MAQTSAIGIYSDIIGSRKITDREELEVHTRSIRAFLERQDKLAFGIWKGLDEYMIIAPGWESAVRIILSIQEISHPYRQRFVMTPFPDPDYSKPVNEMDHPAFGFLSDEMTRLKKTSLVTRIVTQEQNLLLESVSVSLNAIFTLKNDFTARQMEVYCLYKSGLPQKEIAEKLNKSQQYVSQTLNTINFDILNPLEQQLLQILSHGTNQ